MAVKPFLLKMGLVAVVCVLGMLIVADAVSPRDNLDRKSVNLFLDHYFSSWSNRNMVAYKNCFHPDATIVFLDRAYAPHAFPSLDFFIRTQEEAHQKSLGKMREVPLDKRITMVGKMSQATVRWKLVKGLQTLTGVDLFTLILTPEGWKILNLTFLND